MEGILKANFWFALVCKLVVEVQKEHFSFHLCGLATWREHERESLVWFGSQWRSYKVLFFAFTWVCHMYKKLEVFLFAFKFYQLFL
jgi:hypothetical protein